MPRIENVLYILTDGAYLRKDHESIVVSVDKQAKLQVPFRQLEGVVVVAGAGISPDLLGALVDAQVFVAFFTSNGRFLARVEGLPGGNVLLRKAQVRASDLVERSVALARAFVIGKVASQRRQLRRAAREAEPDAAVRCGRAADQLAVMGRRAFDASEIDELRGCEGAAAHDYFQVFNDLISSEDEAMRFSGRKRRPPGDPINAMLSFGYALLMRDCAGALAGIGLDPAIGFLHEDRPGRLGLALDLMEELRVPVVDRLVLAMVNRRQLDASHFRARDDGGWEMRDDGRRTFLAAYQKAKQQTIHHVFLEQETIWGLVPHLQARLLARTLRGDLEDYPPFEVK